MSADPPALSIKLSQRGTFADPSQICANRNLRKLARMCKPVANPRTCRKSTNLSRICREPGQPVANLCKP
eukprot:5169754-Prymnesium_polylepis.1